MEKGKGAIVIMAKHPQGGDVKTRLSPALSKSERIALYTRLLDGTVARLRNVRGAETFIAYTPAGTEDYFRERYSVSCFEQEGEDLGQRLSSALEQLLTKGYMSAVAVGSDIPGLDSRIALNAIDSMKKADIAIGPSTDGGFYLIGIKEPRPELFKDIPWSTAEVLKLTLGKASRMGLKVEILEILDDVDTPEDLRRLGLS